jgi:Chaperone of endosialidase
MKNQTPSVNSIDSVRKSRNRPSGVCWTRAFFSIPLALALTCLALAPAARAVCQEGCDTNSNTFLGDDALLNNTIGSHNTAIGFQALFSNKTGGDNTAIGYKALYSNSIGADNTANGTLALNSNTSGSGNTAMGSSALALNSTGYGNTAVGVNALFSNTTGNSNIGLGDNAGLNLTTGTNNIDIGNPGVAGDSRRIRIGTTGTQTKTFIAGISGATVSNGVGVIVGSNGQLGTVVSSERFKDNVQPMDKASEAILALKPVTFHYKHELDPAGIPQFGLVAEEVAKVNPDLVAHDDDSKPYTVRYEAVNAMLLNEFLKEHHKIEEQNRRIQEQETTITELEKRIKTVIARLEQQASQIQKVSAQMETSKLPAQVVNNP